jgi:hypothetical protein
VLLLVMIHHMKNLLLINQVITMTPCDMVSCNFRCLQRLMHIWSVVPTNANRHLSKPKTEEQKEARPTRDRLNYAKKHPIQKRPRKDIINGRTNVVDCDDPPLEELEVRKLGNNNDILSCNFICFNSVITILNFSIFCIT